MEECLDADGGVPPCLVVHVRFLDGGFCQGGVEQIVVDLEKRVSGGFGLKYKMKRTIWLTRTTPRRKDEQV